MVGERDTTRGGACALCGRASVPTRADLTTLDSTGQPRRAWACADCAARHPTHAALVLALFQRAASLPENDGPPTADS